tara:strand:- start:252 stop:1223 length:972 start_codon:yes stop_codon:yes gene_type:complete
MDMYGYSNALSQGSAFNARTKNFNDGVLLANQKLKDKFEAEIKQKPNTLADDNLKEGEDAAKATIFDGKSTIGALAGLGDLSSGIKNTGFAGYMVDSTKGRLQSIGNTARSIVKGEPLPKPVPRIQPSEVGADGKIVAEGKSVTNDLENAGKAVNDAKAAAGEEIETSGLGAKIIKGGLKFAGGAKLGEAGLTAVSEIGGKALGDFGGLVSVGKGFENLKEGKSFFSGEDTGDKLQEIGAAADVVGTIFPPLEVVGGITSAIGGVMEAYKDIKADMDKKEKDAGGPDPPKLTATKVTPAFSSLGLAASAPISAKASIQGSATF